MATSPTPDEVLRIGPVEVHPVGGLVMVSGRTLRLSVRELALLAEFARRAGRIVSRADLYRLVWQATLRPGDRSVDVYVHKLRSKLEQAAPGWLFIHTHVGFGYRFAPEPRAAQAAPAPSPHGLAGGAPDR
jgi:DNA-binding response OmpR family regulator